MSIMPIVIAELRGRTRDLERLLMAYKEAGFIHDVDIPIERMNPDEGHYGSNAISLYDEIMEKQIVDYE